MFDFENLDVYTKAKEYYLMISKVIESKSNINRPTTLQLNRSSLSIVLNIAEGSGRFSKPDKRRFYIISRGSVFETISIADLLKDLNIISLTEYTNIYNDAEELSKMLWILIKRLEKPKL